MTIIYSGFDTIVFAVQGALSPEAIMRMRQAKTVAEQERRDIPYHVDGNDLSASITCNGMKGGYAFVITTGPLGQRLSFKENLSRADWNGFVKIRALSLASQGWHKAVDEALHVLECLGFHVSGISLNRVDYCMDFLDTCMTLHPIDFIAHSRMKKMGRYIPSAREKLAASTCNENDLGGAINTSMRSDEYEGITIGKMPGRQVIIYDKRREALDKRKFAWFKIWGIDRHDPTKTVRRIELRAGKNELQKWNIRTFDDFYVRIGDLFTKTAQSVRMVTPDSEDSNISRRPVHPTWLHVQSHVQEQLFDHVSNATRRDIKEVIREEKAREYMAQIRGNIAGFAVCEGVAFEDISCVIPDVLRSELQMATNDPDQPFRKTYVKAQDRLLFI